LTAEAKINPYVLGTKYYIRLYRNTSVAYGFSAYSDPDYKIKTHEDATIPCISTIITMDHFIIKNNTNPSTSDSTIQGRIEDIQVWTNANTGRNMTPQQGTNLTNNIGLVDMHFDPVAFAIHMDTDRTTETQLKFRTNLTGNLFFTDADNVRTVDMTDITDSTFRFINMNRVLEGNLETPTVWMQIEGVTPFSAIHINRIMYQRFNRLQAHFHHRIEKSIVENTWDADDPDGVRTTM
jgi:hypothetical protein